jgi:hypothetical protein
MKKVSEIVPDYLDGPNQTITEEDLEGPSMYLELQVAGVPELSFIQGNERLVSVAVFSWIRLKL